MNCKLPSKLSRCSKDGDIESVFGLWSRQEYSAANLGVEVDAVITCPNSM